VTAGRALRDTLSGVFPSVAYPARLSVMNHLCSNSARAFAFLVMLFSAHLAFAGNQNVGTLSGRVSDQSGGSIAFATVTLLDGEHAIKGTQTSDVGTYQLSGLPPGYYRIRVTAKGFASTESSLFDLVTTRSKVLNLTLNVESVKEEIDVNSESPGTLNTEKDANANGITVTGKQLDALPDDPDDLQADLVLSPVQGPFRTARSSSWTVSPERGCLPKSRFGRCASTEIPSRPSVISSAMDELRSLPTLIRPNCMVRRFLPSATPR